MSVNQIYSINQEKVKRFGKYFGSIDFEVASTNRQQLKFKGDKVKAGEFCIGSKRYECSLEDLDAIVEGCHLGEFKIQGNEYECTNEELKRIVETCYTAKNVFFSKFRFAI